MSDIILLASCDETNGDTLLIRTRQHAIDHLIEGAVTTNGYKSTIS